MQQFRSPRSVVVTAVAVTLIALGVFGLVANRVVASGPPFAAGPMWAIHGWHRDFAALAPELAGLMDVPARERFTHVRGVQVQLTDKDNQPVHVVLTPGTVTSVSGTSLTISGNDGSNHTYGLDDKTVGHAQAINSNDAVVVATLNGRTTATAVYILNADGFGPRGPWGR